MTSLKCPVTCWTACLALFLLNACSQSTATPDGKVVSFIQFTDAHLFDGKRDTTDGESPESPGLADQTENAAAVRWAARVIAKTKPAVDFVVFTGDLGLECVHGSPADKTAKTCAFRYSMDQAVNTVSLLLGKVPVRMFFLPGNNDLLNEDVADLGRYHAFMNALTHKCPNMVDLSGNPVATTRFGGYRIVGVDSAAFKYPGKNSPICKQHGEDSGCPQAEVGNVQKIIADECPSSRVVIFTHVPDLDDPHTLKSSWNIPSETNNLWMRLQRQTCVAGLFAGHFHSQDFGRYGVPISRDPDSPAQAHLWVAPPLANKYQNPEARMARGVLYVNLPANGEPSVTTLWYDAVPAGAGTSAPASGK